MASILNQTIVRKDFKTADMASAPGDNADIFIVAQIPAGREVAIYDMRAFVTLASDTVTDSIELVNDSNTVLAQVFIGATGHVSSFKADGVTASAFPFNVAVSSSNQTLKLRTNGATDATTDVAIEVVIDNPYDA